jgi:hypothetical protein
LDSIDFWKRTECVLTVVKLKTRFFEWFLGCTYYIGRRADHFQFSFIRKATSMNTWFYIIFNTKQQHSIPGTQIDSCINAAWDLPSWERLLLKIGHLIGYNETIVTKEIEINEITERKKDFSRKKFTTNHSKLSKNICIDNIRAIKSN